MNKLKNALISIESRFLLSIQDGPKEWGALSSNWSLLRDQLEQGARNKTLDTELISLARAVSGRIGIIAEGQLALYAASQKLTTKFVQDIDDTFAHTASIIDTPEAAYETLSAPRNTEGAKDLGGMARPGTETYIPPSSPHPSHPSTPTSTPLADVDDDDTPAPRVAGVKRRASVQEENSDLCSPRSLKRSRISTSTNSSFAHTTSPSPSLSPDAPLLPTPAPVQTARSPATEPSTFAPSRKRRLSDADPAPISKRLRGMDSVHRPSIAFDCLDSDLTGGALDSYNFGDLSSPPSISMAPIDPSVPLDISLFDWSAYAQLNAEPISYIAPMIAPWQQLEVPEKDLEGINIINHEASVPPFSIDDFADFPSLSSEFSYTSFWPSPPSDAASPNPDSSQSPVDWGQLGINWSQPNMGFAELCDYLSSPKSSSSRSSSAGVGTPTSSNSLCDAFSSPRKSTNTPEPTWDSLEQASGELFQFSGEDGVEPFNLWTTLSSFWG